ncbi:MAG: hypothetical protein K1Y36_02570 [Blastocatellia bacterium]|nr:hypothetical protein [Blastocatellia bacterium]
MSKFIKHFAILLVIVAGLWVPALARKEKRVIVVPRPCVLQGQSLVPGTYVAEFDESQEGKLVILDGRKEIAKADYHLESLKNPAEGDTLEFTNQDGTRRIVRVNFKGLAKGLRFE